ncbi:MAG: branched-chain amino acid ABC transporter permease, partial [Pseudomonadota bacterium]|nr:branched-chain amino acid ABC transporter permease [Pseudomonadota bacterium]
MTPSIKSSATKIVALIALIGLALVPVIGSRAMVQDLFMVLTMLVLALNWNMLAGFAGLVSVGQQAFVGIGAYGMFAAVILWGLDPLIGIVV